MATHSRKARGRPDVATDTTDEDNFKKWSRQAPKASASLQPLGGKLPNFFLSAKSLVYDAQTQIKQQVISTLAGEGGLARIKEAVETCDTALNDPQNLQHFERVIGPLFEVLSHHEVHKSLVLESQVDGIHNFLFGNHGQRAIKLFSFVSTVFPVLLARSAEAELIVLFIASLTVLNKIVDVNGGAKITEALPPIVQTLSQFATVQFGNSNVQHSGVFQLLDRIERVLGLGSSIRSATNGGPKREDTILPKFDLGRDLPGSLSPEGPRHDNDHDDIDKIQIMPTTSEITSTKRSEYLPVKDPTKWHLPGVRGLLDRHFRLLREDTIGQLRDAVRLLVDRLNDPVTKGTSRLPRPLNSARVDVYENIRLEQITCNKNVGLRMLVSFNQPVRKTSIAQLKQYWEISKNLRHDSLLCLVNSTGSAHFLSVHDEKSKNASVTRAKGFFEDLRRAKTLLRFVEPFGNDINLANSCFSHGQKTSSVLVEFPGILLPSFYPTLRALQRMITKPDVPFSNLIAPIDAAHLDARVLPPRYSRSPGFSFDMSCLVQGEDLSLNPGLEFDYDTLNGYSTLDEAQQRAVVDALTRELALVQGPPGTGKSYTGVAILKVLLANATKAEMGPIICVCYTNHALDQLLEHLVKDGVKQIIRVGGRSKSELLKPINLRNVVSKMEDTRYERNKKYQLSQTLESLAKAISEKLPDVTGPTPPDTLKSYLMENHEGHYRELFDETDEEGFQTVSHDPFDKWLKPSRPPFESFYSNAKRPVEILEQSPLSEMKAAERHTLHAFWLQEIRDEALSQLSEDLQSFSETKRKREECNQELDLRCLKQANVIGITTSGLAKHLNILRRLDAKVLLCEEAGEVLEAHLLTTLLPSIEHAILIGDHEQLRPRTQNYGLQHENSEGEKYSLDVSLFERLIDPPEWGATVPHTTLEVQRRMDPSIAQLIRKTLYPYLKDHPSVSEYPQIVGLAKRLYWLDHREKEVQLEYSTSHLNPHEVEMTAALVSHLVRQGVYQAEDIAILTPYAGQLFALRKRLMSSFEIVISDLDAEELENQGLQVDGMAPMATRKSSLLRALRLATVDNFQGEEAKVIVVSLVRSNPENKVGFLRTSNRINVLLSRAKHGMYIIGNSETYANVKMWSQVISILKEHDNISSSLPLLCPRHPENSTLVSSPDDFVRLVPEGGCTKNCMRPLKCGHTCQHKCHADPLHFSANCREQYSRTRTGCGHSCTLQCGDDLPELCQSFVRALLQCNHGQNIRCYQTQDLSSVVCSTTVSKTIPNCGHVVQVACSSDVSSANCDTIVSKTIPRCGHTAKVRCSVDIENIDDCQRICNAILPCDHRCLALCHEGTKCPPCAAPCETICTHSRCARNCSEQCEPCAKRCEHGCEHVGKCALPCSVPCDILPCSLRCDKFLVCGHQCPSLCSEGCPTENYCQVCCPESIKAQIVDFSEMRYADVNLNKDPCLVPSCGHLITMASLDDYLRFKNKYERNGFMTDLQRTSIPFSSVGIKGCPSCQMPLRPLNRYSRVFKRNILDKAAKKLIARTHTEFVPLTQRLQDLEQYLLDNQTISRDSLYSMYPETQLSLLYLNQSRIQSRGGRKEMMTVVKLIPELRERHLKNLELRAEIRSFLKKMTEQERPFVMLSYLLQLVLEDEESAGSITHHNTLPQTRSSLLANSLSIRCDLAILTDVLVMRGKRLIRGAQRNWTGLDIDLNFAICRNECLAFSDFCAEQGQYMLAIEAMIYLARFAILELHHGAGTHRRQAIQFLAISHLQDAKRFCSMFPAQTIGLEGEVDTVLHDLEQGVLRPTVISEERQQVYDALTREHRGTRDWYSCQKGHPFQLGGYGISLETIMCPQCGSPAAGIHEM